MIYYVLTSLPTLTDHNNGIGIERGESNKSYLERYVEAKNSELAERFQQGFIGVRLTLSYDLAQLAFTYVHAKFRLQDISQSIRDDNDLRIAAQQADVDEWSNRIEKVKSGYTAFQETILFFDNAAIEARKPDSEEDIHVSLGYQGRISEITVPTAPHRPYSFEIPGEEWNSGFNQKPSNIR